jgi:cytidine deaminase
MKSLIAAARKARAKAYAPYSGFKVGAAVQVGGRSWAGCNVENASYGLAICAERAAVVQAVAAGARRIDAVAVVTGTRPPSPPCGMCLQTLAEFAGSELPILLEGKGGTRAKTTLGALLPRRFGKGDLKR